MSFDTWEPIYESILAAFGYDRTADQQARDILATVSSPYSFDQLRFSGDTVAIVGAAPCLDETVEHVESADRIIAASTAADTIRTAGYDVDLMVTDLDKNPITARTLTHEGTPVAVHAHGDNVDAIRNLVPTFAGDAVIPTTQAAPSNGVSNPGGFTDGDRAAFLADALHAESLQFVGWDFDDTTVTEQKSAKLVWAERLLELLERRRGEKFAILDNRRGAIETIPIPTR
nr:6-hydroxymethylpterin diphosphokinase MptE-like protein [Haloquadratum walsbyi]